MTVGQYTDMFKLFLESAPCRKLTQLEYMYKRIQQNTARFNQIHLDTTENKLPR